MKQFYLTIDDGPSPTTLQKINILKKYNASAVFFFRGEYMLKFPDILKASIQEGFTIGNHAFDHPHFSELTLKQGKEQITKTEALINAAYLELGIQRKHHLFRFPYLDKGKEKKAAFQQILQDLGFEKLPTHGISYHYFAELDQDIDVSKTYDACEYALFAPQYMKKHGLFTTQDFINRMHRQEPENGFGLHSDSNDIILMHDFESTHFLFEPMISELSTSFNAEFAPLFQ